MKTLLDLVYLGVAASGCASILRIPKTRLNRLPLFLVALSTAAIWGKWLPGGPIAPLAPVVVTMFILPGYLLLESFFPALSRDLIGLTRIPVSFGLTMAIWMPIAVVAFRTQCPSDFVIGFVLLGVIGGLFFLHLSRRPGSEPFERREIQRPPIPHLIIVLCIVLAVVSGTVGISSQYQRNDFDSSFHLAGYNKIAQGDRIIGGNPFLGPGYSYLPQYVANPWYLAFGLSARLSHMSVSWLYVFLAAIMTAFVFITFFFLLMTLLKSVEAAILGTLITIGPWVCVQALRWGPGMDNFYLQFLPFPYSCNELIIFPLWLAFCFRYAATKSRNDWFMTSFLAIAAFGIHPESLVIIPFSTGIVFLLSFAFPDSARSKKKTFALMGTIVLAAGVVAYLIKSYPVPGGSAFLKGPGLRADLIGSEEEFLKKAWTMGRHLYALHPRILISDWKDVFGWLVAPLLMIGYAKWMTKKSSLKKGGGSSAERISLFDEQKDRWRLIATAGAIYYGPWLIIFNPVVVPWVIKTLGSSWSISYIPIYFLILTTFFEVAFIASLLAGGLFPRTESGRGRTLKSFLLYGMIALSLGIPLFSSKARALIGHAVFDNWNPSIIDEARSPFYSGLAKLDPGIVAIRPEQSEFVAMNTSHFVLSSCRMPVERQMDNEKIINFSVPLEEVKRLLLKYDCRYIAVPKNASLIKNGGFEKNAVAWDAVSCWLNRIPGGQSGSCLQLTRTRYDAQSTYQDITCDPGKYYLIEGYFKSGTSGAEPFGIWIYRHQVSGNGEYSIQGTTTGQWVKYSMVFRANYRDLCVLLRKNSATPGSMLFDSISCIEVRPRDPALFGALNGDKQEFSKGYVGDNGGSQGEWAPDSPLYRLREHPDIFEEVLNLEDYSVFKVNLSKKR